MTNVNFSIRNNFKAKRLNIREIPTKCTISYENCDILAKGLTINESTKEYMFYIPLKNDCYRVMQCIFNRASFDVPFVKIYNYDPESKYFELARYDSSKGDDITRTAIDLIVAYDKWYRDYIDNKTIHYLFDNADKPVVEAPEYDSDCLEDMAYEKERKSIPLKDYYRALTADDESSSNELMSEDVLPF